MTPELRRRLLVLAAPLASAGCLYTDVRVPRAYRSATPADVKAAAADETVTGRACNHTVLYLVALGDAGYAAAAADALKDRRDAALYDVKADTKVTSALLGLYSRVCTVLTGKAGRL